MASSGPPQRIPTPPQSPLHDPTAAQKFDIVQKYKNLLLHDSLVTPPIAAIESLIELLNASPPSTVSETLSLLSDASRTLKLAIPYSLALTAGTDLFQRYIISTLQTGSSSTQQDSQRGDDDFQATRRHLLENSKLFVQRAKEARGLIAQRARGFVRDGTTVLTCGDSRVVRAVLEAAAQDGVRFQVIHAETASPKCEMVRSLRAQKIPVAVIPFAALATAIAQASFVMIGAEAVVENGGILSGMGALQMGILAKSKGKAIYVVVESYKFVRYYPLRGDGEEVGIAGKLVFKTENDEEESDEGVDDVRLDFTPPDLITALVTESGVHTPSAVSEELIKIWY